MSVLSQHLRREFGTKVYPNLKDPGVLAELREGERKFRTEYLGMVYPWVLAGDIILPPYDALGGDYSAYFTTHRPYDKSIVGYFPKYDPLLMDLPTRLVRVREAGLRFWRETRWQDRVWLLQTISGVAKERYWLLCAAKGYEEGQSRPEQVGETDEEVDFPLANAWYLDRLHNLDSFLLPSPAFAGDLNGKRHITHGVFLNICPFNFPGAIPMDMATKALALGNAVIEKSSPKSALSGYLVYETLRIAFERCGIDHRGVINYAPGDADVVNAMLADPNISGMSFTGSTNVLDSIKARHGTMLRKGFSGTKAPLVYGSVETSGVNPFVVAPDADPVHAAGEAVRAVVGRQGQKCSSARLLFVHDSHYDVFVATLKERMDALVYGDVVEGADIGAMATQADVDKIFGQINHAVGEGRLATVLYTKTECRGNGYDFPPMVLLANHDALISTKRSKELMNLEFFGPVTTVIRYGDLKDVEHLLSLSEFALTGSIFSNDVDTIARLLDILPAGNVYLNRKCTGALVETECFGGLRSRSGLGIKGFMALALFGSQQTLSGFYPKNATEQERYGLLHVLQQKGFVLSKS